MNKRGFIGFFAFSLVVASIASATAQNTRQVRQGTRDMTALTDPHLPVETALRWGYSQGYRTYPSGFGGLYGDGRYPGNVISNGKDRP
jgi:hypothetical protein